MALAHSAFPPSKPRTLVNEVRRGLAVFCPALARKTPPLPTYLPTYFPSREAVSTVEELSLALSRFSETTVQQGTLPARNY